MKTKSLLLLSLASASFLQSGLMAAPKPKAAVTKTKVEYGLVIFNGVTLTIARPNEPQYIQKSAQISGQPVVYISLSSVAQTLTRLAQQGWIVVGHASDRSEMSWTLELRK